MGRSVCAEAIKPAGAAKLLAELVPLEELRPGDWRWVGEVDENDMLTADGYWEQPDLMHGINKLLHVLSTIGTGAPLRWGRSSSACGRNLCVTCRRQRLVAHRKVQAERRAAHPVADRVEWLLQLAGNGSGASATLPERPREQGDQRTQPIPRIELALARPELSL